MNSELGARAFFGGIAAVLLSLGGGILIAYIEAYAGPPPESGKMTRSSVFSLGVMAGIWSSASIAIGYGFACLIHLAISPSPSPFLLGTLTPFLYLLFAKTGVLSWFVNWIPIDFGPNSDGVAEIALAMFGAGLATALAATAIFWVVETLIRAFRQR